MAMLKIQISTGSLIDPGRLLTAVEKVVSGQDVALEMVAPLIQYYRNQHQGGPT